MIPNKVRVLLWLLAINFVNENDAQSTATITPNGFNASLDPESNFTFQCDVTEADDIGWLIDSIPLSREEIKDRGIGANKAIALDRATYSLRGFLSIPINEQNRNTSIDCLAIDAFTPRNIVYTFSEPVFFKVQGLLDAPSNLILSEAGNQFMRRLSWEEPFSLDIINVEPDISYYRICSSFSNDSNESVCTQVEKTEFTFIYVNIPLLFTVSAVNVVGEGDSASILHDGNACSSSTGLTIQKYRYPILSHI